MIGVFVTFIRVVYGTMLYMSVRHTNEMKDNEPFFSSLAELCKQEIPTTTDQISYKRETVYTTILMKILRNCQKSNRY